MLDPALHSNVNFPTPLSVLGFIGGVGGCILILLAATVALYIGQRGFASRCARAFGVIALLYMALLLGFSLASRTAVLARGEEKYFCEIDCHLAYSVQQVESTPRGDIVDYVVTLQTRFDENTISATRPRDAPLNPNPRQAFLVDDQGRHYSANAVSGTSLEEKLRPGERYHTMLGFQVPAHARGLRRLLTTRPARPDHLVIGDENSMAHAKTYFAI